MPMNILFDGAIARIRGIVGEAYVFTDEKDRERYSQCTIPWRRTCAAVVFPGNSEEICDIMRVAQEYKVAVWPFSKGKNWGYGTMLAAHDGAIILILERLNKIIEVNEELAYAVIEPGVTYRQLNQYLKEHKIKLWIDSTDGPPEGSVLGNALDKGAGTTPYYDHFGNLCGMEVILPNGSVFRTGGGPPNLKTWNTYKWGTGPYLDGLFVQSNLGIVTRAGIWLMPEPEDFRSFLFELRDEKKLPSVIDAIRNLMLQHALQNAIHASNDIVTFAIVTQYLRDARPGTTCLSEVRRAELRKKYGVAPWSFGGGLYGSTAQVRLHQRLLKRTLSRYGKLTFLSDRDIGNLQRVIRLWKRLRTIPFLTAIMNASARYLVGKSFELIEAAPSAHAMMKGIPGEYFVRHAYFKAARPKPDIDIDPVRDQCGLIWFAPMTPMTGPHITEILALCRPLFKKYQFDFYFVLLVKNARSMIALMSIFYRREEPDEVIRAGALYRELCAMTLAAGYQQYRAAVPSMEHILTCAPEFQQFANLIKAAVDPENILAPGRYGVGTTKEAVTDRAMPA